jgi:D-alanyl-D-alanine carboxypeptidase
MRLTTDSERCSGWAFLGVHLRRLSRFHQFSGGLLILALAGCGVGPSATPTPQPTITLASAPRLTPTAGPTSTEAPSATPLPPPPTLEPPSPPTATPVPPTPTVAAWTTDTTSAIDAVAQNLLNTVPLVGLTLAIRQGARPAYIQGYGSANILAHVPAQAGTLYEIASLSKQFTAAAILQLAEQGKLQLDAPAVNYLPDLPAAAQTITVRQLLNHTSGVPRNDYLYVQLNRPQPYPPSTVLETYEQSFNALSFDPGTAWEYSNLGYFILGVIIESVSGQSYGDYLAQHVFSAAGLTTTSYCVQPPTGLAQGYLTGGPQWTSVPSENLSLAFAAGGLCSTAPDLLAWQQALAAGRVVSPAAYQAMIAPVTLPDGTQTFYGFGLKIGVYGGQPAIYHQGAITGFGSVLAYYPGDDLTVVLLTNTQAPTEQLDAAVSRLRAVLAAQP